MHVHPAIAALRANPALQRRAQAQMAAAREAGLASEIAKGVHSDLLQYGKGAELSTLSELSLVMTDQVAAQRLIKGQNDPLIAALRREPLGEVPLRQTSSAGFARMQLLEVGGVTLSLCIYEPAQHSHEPSCVQFADCEVHELVLAGEARGQSHQLIARGGRLALQTQSRNWRRGNTITCYASCNARQILQVHETMLILQLTRSPDQPPSTVELSLPDGELIREVSGNKRASEQVMALGVLGALEDVSAISAMIEFAHRTENDVDARWEAVRQTLSLDSEHGLALLRSLAECAGDPLSKPSRALSDQLLCEFPILSAPAKGSA